MWWTQILSFYSGTAKKKHALEEENSLFSKQPSAKQKQVTFPNYFSPHETGKGEAVKYGEFLFSHSEGDTIKSQKRLNSFSSRWRVENGEISNQDANLGPSGRVKPKQWQTGNASVPTAVTFYIVLSTQSHLEVLYDNNHQNDRRPLSTPSPEEVQLRNPSCWGSSNCSGIFSLHMCKTDAWLGHWIKSAILRKYFCWSWQSGCEIVKEWIWHPQTARLFQVYLILEPHIRTGVHTFLLWCCAILESQLFHSIAIITGSSGLYLSVVSQNTTATYIRPLAQFIFYKPMLSKKLNTITVLELLCSNSIFYN